MRKLILILALALPALAIAQPAVQWHEPAPTDLAPGAAALQSMKAVPPITANANREPVEFSMALEPGAVLDPGSDPIVSESRSYWLDLSAKALASGVRLPLTAPGAVIRISPVGAKAAAIDPASIGLVAAGQALGPDAIRALADHEALKAAGMPVARGSLAFRLDDSVTSDVTLRVPSLAKAGEAAYLVHVFEPRSSVVLKLSSPRPDAVIGERVRFQLELAGVAGTLKAGELRGYLASPDGASTAEVRFVDGKAGGVVAEVETAGLETGPGLWELHAYAEKATTSGTVLRDGKSVVQLAAPTARLAGQASLAGADRLSLALDVAAPGRYEVAGVLYGEQGGAWTPLATVASARWIEAGTGRIELAIPDELAERFDRFQLRQLALRDQSRLATLWRQSLGLSIDLSALSDSR